MMLSVNYVRVSGANCRKKKRRKKDGMTRKIDIFDTTLRDGEQSPGASMNTEEKLVIARQLLRLNVDVIEAGFPISSPGDFESVRRISELAGDAAVVCALTRAVDKDIDSAADALKFAKRPRIHTGIGVSPSHMRDKLRITEDECIERAVHAVSYAKKYVEDVQFYAEDAGRSDFAFLARVIEAVIKAGATVVNIPDTTGYSLPEDFGARIKYLMDNVAGIDDVTVSVHCHNDLGMATALSLAGVRNGATQIECTINGIGERAGNASMEECVMALKTRADHFGIGCNIETTQIYRASRMIQTITGVAVAPTKPIVGANAFAHEAGIHQHGVMANKETYEIMTPESVGIPKNAIVLGKHSGRHAFEERLHELGYTLDHEKLEKAFEKFKILADKKKVIKDRDLEGLIGAVPVSGEERYTLDRFVINSGNTITSTAVIRVKKGDEMFERAAASDGPINASFHAIDKIIGKEIVLEDYSLRALTDGEDAQSEAIVKIRVDGSNEVVTGRGVSVDVMEASIKAYINGINKYFND